MTEQDFLKSVGVKIRELRNKSGLTQDEVAEKAGIYRADLSALEHGKEKIKSIDIIRRIVEATGHTMKDVFDQPAAPEKKTPNPDQTCFCHFSKNKSLFYH